LVPPPRLGACRPGRRLGSARQEEAHGEEMAGHSKAPAADHTSLGRPRSPLSHLVADLRVGSTTGRHPDEELFLVGTKESPRYVVTVSEYTLALCMSGIVVCQESS
jgi:hypothetical protein